MRTLAFLILTCFLTSCVSTVETTYSKEIFGSHDTYETDIMTNESAEDWSIRVISILEENKVDVIEYWLDDSDKKPSMCGCWSCTNSGYTLKVITTTPVGKMEELGFE